MLCITDSTTDPYWNLAAEEFLLTGIEEPVFRLWRNAPSVIVGRYQNSTAEINTEYVKSHGIPVVRRMTGGGAVFHDLGNVNYTFIDKKIAGEDTASVIGERKFSGNAVCVHGDRVLQHGCMLFSASVTDLSAALNTRPEKFTGKSVQSNRARVTNISEHLPEGKAMSVEDFIAYLQDYIAGRPGFTLRGYLPQEKAVIDRLREEKYSTWQWNFGNSPRYGLNKTHRFPWGFIEVSLDVSEGIIRYCSIRGDYFFTRPTEEVEQALTGLPLRSSPSIRTHISAFLT